MEVRGELPIESDRVYVIPPDRALRISDSRLGAVPFEEPHGQRAPIDTLFRSPAEQHGDGFAVILSGGDDDGAAGVRMIKEAGGLVLVQEPAEAAFDAMPRAAIATGAADLVLPARRARADQATRARAPRQGARAGARDGGGGGTATHRLPPAHAHRGADFARYKRATVLRRIARRVQINQRVTLDAYAGYVRRNAEEAQTLFDDLLITVTRFFRDAEAWQALAARVVPELFEARPDGRPLRARAGGVPPDARQRRERR